MKLKKILCTLIISICSLNLSGCKPDDTPPTTPEEKETTLTLNEAKTLINNALSIDGANPVSNRNSNQGNRNIFTKLQTAEFDFNSQGGLLINGLLQKQGATWVKYALTSTSDGVDYNSYYDGEFEYTEADGNYLKSEFGDSYFGLVVQTLDIMYLDILFLDSAWESIYNSSATKTPVTDGYKITLDVDMARYVEYASDMCEDAGIPLDGLFGEGTLQEMNKEDGSISLSVNFDKSLRIIGLDLNITSYAVAGSLENATLEDTVISVKKYTGNIQEPTWFDVNNYQ